MKVVDDLKIYLDKEFRSSIFVLEAWKLVESDMLYAIGMSESPTITIYIDNDSILLAISSECSVLCSKIKQFNTSHVLSTMTEMSIAAAINFKTSEKCKTEYKKSSFYFEKNNVDDQGAVEIECDCYYNVETFNDFKLEVIMTIVEELQFLIHRNIFKSDIETCRIANIDSKLEIISVYKKIKKTTFEKAMATLLTCKKINIEDSEELLKTYKRIVNEKIRQRL